MKFSQFCCRCLTFLRAGKVSITDTAALHVQSTAAAAYVISCSLKFAFPLCRDAAGRGFSAFLKSLTAIKASFFSPNKCTKC